MKRQQQPPNDPSPSFASNPSAPSHGDIAAEAVALWRQKGCPQSRDDEIWLEAERQLRQLPLLETDGTDATAISGRGFSFNRGDFKRGEDFSSDEVMGELNERFPGPTGRETTSL